MDGINFDQDAWPMPPKDMNERLERAKGTFLMGVGSLQSQVTGGISNLKPSEKAAKMGESLKENSAKAGVQLTMAKDVVADKAANLK